MCSIVFQGGVSKSIAVIKAFEEETGKKIYVDKYAHLMGALEVAILTKNSEKEQDFNIAEMHFETREIECEKCPNNCETICVFCVYINNDLIDAWGNKCDNGAVV